MSPAPQMNLRLRDGLDVQLRVRAAQDGVDIRELVEDALITTYGFNRSGDAPTPGQTEIAIEEAAKPMREAIRRQIDSPAPDMPQGASEVVSEAPAGGCPECGETLNVAGACPNCRWRRGEIEP